MSATSIVATPLRKQAGDPYFVAGIGIYLLFAVVALFADAIAPNSPKDILFLPDGRLANALAPSAEFLLGTTTSGNDIFSQLVHGAQSALIVGTSAAFVVVTVGTLVGLLAGYFGGLIDAVLMRIADVALGMPLLPFVIVLAAFLGPSTWNVVLAMSLLLWPNSARIIRSQVLSLRNVRILKPPAPRVRAIAHSFPPHRAEHLPVALLFGSIAIGWAILTEASVSFLGFADPDTTTWGFMLQDAYVSQALSRGLIIGSFRLASASSCWFRRVFHQPQLRAVSLSSAAGLAAVAEVLAAETTQTQQRRDVPTLLSVRDLRVSYRSERGLMHAVDGANFSVGQAEMVGLVGESGCGKTTAARALTGVMAGNARITVAASASRAVSAGTEPSGNASGAVEGNRLRPAVGDEFARPGLSGRAAASGGAATRGPARSCGSGNARWRC